jgi:hypothetical protein
MKLFPLIRVAAVLVAATGSLFGAILPGTNLLSNGSATEPVTSGWSGIVNGGSGWTNTSSGGYDTEGGYFITSYIACSRSQTIDLLAKGLTAEELDAGAPIRVSEAISMDANNGGNDRYYIKVELRDAAGAAIAKWEAGTSAAMKAATTSWVLESFVFRNYGPGVRSVYFEDGGIDGGYWNGFYGTRHDAARVEFIDSLPTDITLTPSTIGEGTPPGGIVGYLTAADDDGVNAASDHAGSHRLAVFRYRGRASRGLDGDGVRRQRVEHWRCTAGIRFHQCRCVADHEAELRRKCRQQAGDDLLPQDVRSGRPFDCRFFERHAADR